MDLYLQFGHGMMGLSREMISKWNGGTVILSPRDLTYKQMVRFSTEICERGGNVVFDPQFYVPTSAHKKLTKHSYWPDDYQSAWLSETSIGMMLRRIQAEYNEPFSTEFFILPAIRSTEIGEDWFSINEMIMEQATKLEFHDTVYATLCLSAEVMSSEEQSHLVLEHVEKWQVDGFYIVPEPPTSSYLVDDPVWLVNLLDFVAGVKQLNKKAVVGYASHQMLCLALAKADAIASGNWLNVRSFNTARFNAPIVGQSRRSTWYYCPQALSEYQIVFLDVANRLGFLDQLKSPSEFESGYAEVLFSGAQPSATNYSEKHSFRQYLQCLKKQALQATKSDYESTKASLQLQLETALQLTQFLRSQGVRGRDRDFANVVDVNISAIGVFDQLRGMIQRAKWSSL